MTNDLATRIANRSRVVDSGCWEWTSGLLASGYGQMQVSGRKMRAHRASYEAFVGPIPEGLFILHSCHNPPCVNPDHLRVGTHAENMQDRTDAGHHNKGKGALQVACDRGHLMVGENLYIAPGSGKRICRPCQKDRAARRYQAKKASA